ATSCSGGAAAESVLSYGTSTSTNDMGAPLSLFGTSVVCGTMGATTHLARRPGAGAVPGRWGACLAVRTPPAAFSLSSHLSHGTIELRRLRLQRYLGRPGRILPHAGKESACPLPFPDHERLSGDTLFELISSSGPVLLGEVPESDQEVIITELDA